MIPILAKSTCQSVNVVRCSPILLAGLILAYVAQSVELKFTLRPSNISTTAGSDVQFTCQTDTNIRNFRWDYHKLGPLGEVGLTLYIGYSGNKNDDAVQNFTVNISQAGQFDLVIYSVKLADAGKYVCRETDINDVASAELIVLDSQPRCTPHWYGDFEEYEPCIVTCNVNYTGNWAPVMVLKQDGGRNMTSVVNRTDVTTMYKSTTYIWSVNVTRTLSGSNFSCSTYFTMDPDKPTDVTNSLYYNFTWNSPTFTVIYGPENLRIIPNRTSYSVGDELECFSDGIPRPTLQWIDLASGQITPGPKLIISDHTELQQFKCLATIDANNRKRNVSISLTAIIVTGDSVSFGVIIGVATGSATVVLAIAVVAAWFIYRKNKERSSATTPDLVPYNVVNTYESEPYPANNTDTAIYAEVNRTSAICPSRVEGGQVTSAPYAQVNRSNASSDNLTINIIENDDDVSVSYSKVIKPGMSSNNLASSNDIPNAVYEDVAVGVDTNLYSDCVSGRAEAQANEQKQSNIGADGTAYAMLATTSSDTDSVSTINSRRPLIDNSMAVSTYAEIDHNMQLPPRRK